MKLNSKKLTFDTFLRPYRLRVVILCLLMLVQSVLQVALALITKNVLDAAILAYGSLYRWGVLLVADLLALILLHSLLSWISGSTMDRCVASLRGKLLRSAVYSRDVRLQGFHSGQLLSRGMEDVNTLCDGMISALPSVVGQVARLIAAFTAVLLIAKSVAAILAVAAVAVILLIAMIRPLLKKRHKAVRLADEKVMSAMQEDLQQLELIQSLDVQENILFRFAKGLRKSLLEKRKRRLVTVGISSLLSIATQVCSGALLLWGAVQVRYGYLTYGALTAMLQLVSQFRVPVLSLAGLWTRFAAVDVAGERLTDLLQVEKKTEQKKVGSVKAVVFEDVSFTYPGDDQPVLEHFSAAFPLDKWACLTGISGKGKTTLFKLILGLYEPQSGKVYLKTEQGNVPCSEGTRHLFAYVPQDFALFSGTIAENLGLVSEADYETVAKALKIAQADFVWELTAGVNTQIRENNTGLSKGQLQRLAIARAVLMDRPILLLDECTSALDGQTEDDLLKSLHQQGKQAILVTHRPEALRDLEQVIPISMEQ